MDFNKPVWMVRAGEGGYLFDLFKEKSLVAIGWGAIGDVSGKNSRESIASAMYDVWPDWHKGKIALCAGQVYRFAHEIEVGDGVITYDSARRVYLLGTITGSYKFQEIIDEQAPDIQNYRTVEWEDEISRDQLSVAAKNSLGAISTLFLLPSDAVKSIRNAVTGEPPESLSEESEEEGQQEELLKDIQSRSIEFIKDRLNRLDWYEMQELVAGLLRAMGYKTQVSPAGPDRGKDIIASPDGFGFESPKIVVEVKHRNQTMGTQALRSFIGGRHKDDKGLYVSTNGFTKEARYEAERSTVPLTLMDLDDLVQALLDNYDQLDIDAQRLIPLRKIYWPA